MQAQTAAQSFGKRFGRLLIEFSTKRLKAPFSIGATTVSNQEIFDSENCVEEFKSSRNTGGNKPVMLSISYRGRPEWAVFAGGSFINPFYWFTVTAASIFEEELISKISVVLHPNESEDRNLRILQCEVGKVVLVDRLISAKKIIKKWHGTENWETYNRSAPEMRHINESIAEHAAKFRG